jgi:hypothetical protein
MYIERNKKNCGKTAMHLGCLLRIKKINFSPILTFQTCRKYIGDTYILFYSLNSVEMHYIKAAILLYFGT